MAVHRKAAALMDPLEAMARLAARASERAESAQTRASGTASWENPDGTRTLIGPQAGGATIATHVGDSTPPGRPLGVAGASSAGVVYVAWGGELEGGTPADFDHVSLYVSIAGTSELVGTLAEAGIVSTVPMATSATVEVWAVAEDDACLADGTPAHNVSAESDHATVAVTQAADPSSVAELRRLLGGAVTGTREEYAASASRAQAPGDGAAWSETPPDSPGGGCVWRRTVTTYGDGTTTRSQPVPLTGESATTIEISSTAGAVIRNGEGSTTLRATVTCGSERVSDAAALASCFGAGARLAWHPLSPDGTVGDEITGARVGESGFTLEVGAADVAGDVTYVCELLTSE